VAIKLGYVALLVCLWIAKNIKQFARMRFVHQLYKSYNCLSFGCLFYALLLTYLCYVYVFDSIRIISLIKHYAIADKWSIVERYISSTTYI